MDWQLIVPGEPGWGQVDWASAREVRLRPGQAALVWLGSHSWRGSHVLSPQDIYRALQALSGHSLAARQEESALGFLPLPGGCRLGICGEWGPRGWNRVHSLCVRLPHGVPGAADGIYPLVKGKSVLIFGPPGSGKTTLLRELIRLSSRDGMQVGVADERGEIAGCGEGQPQLDVGPNTDVVTGMEKSAALALLVRAFSPQVAATDEIGSPADARAIGDAARCGVRVLATAHGDSLDDIKQRPGIGPLLRAGVFHHTARLTAVGTPPVIGEGRP